MVLEHPTLQTVGKLVLASKVHDGFVERVGCAAALRALAQQLDDVAQRQQALDG